VGGARGPGRRYDDAAWAGRAVRLVVSPLWFLAVYLVLIALLPVAL
jgi:hypothetical protein